MELHHVHLLAIWIEGLLYGLYVPLFAAAIYYLVFRPNGRVNKTLLGVTLVLFMLGTMHVAASLKLLVDAFVTYSNQPGGPKAFFAHEADPVNLFRKGVFAFSVLIGDGLVIYRSFIIWSRNWWIVAAPITSLAATFIAGSVVAKEFSSLNGDDDVFSPALVIWVPLYFAFSFITNLLVTSIISLRLWRVSRGVASTRTTTRSRRTVAILIESAAIYPLVNLITLILFAARDPGQAIPANALCQIIGIAPTLIVVQVQAGLSEAGRGGSWSTPNPRSSAQQTGNTTGVASLVTRPSYHVSTFDNRSEPMVISIDRSSEGGYAPEVDMEKKRTTMV